MSDIYKELEDGLVEGVSSLLTMLGETTKVIIANESGLEPKNNYVSIRVVDMQESSSNINTMAHYKEATSRAEGTILTHYKIPVQLTFSGKGSGGVANKVNNSIIKLSQSRVGFQSQGLSPMSKSKLRRVPMFRETGWRDIFKLDVVFSYAQITTYNVDYHDSYNVSTRFTNK